MIASEAEAREWLSALPGFDATAMHRLERLIDLLREENARQNLVSAGSLADVWTRHVADSAQLLAHVPRETGLWIDLGSGAGFPGIVVAILQPERRVVLIESRKRRIEWLQSVATDLSLARIEVFGGRVEDAIFSDAAVISARAFAPLDRLLELSARFSTSDTTWLLPKGRSAHQELAMLHAWNHTFHVEQSLTDPEAGVIVGKLLGPAKRGRKEKGS